MRKVTTIIIKVNKIEEKIITWTDIELSKNIRKNTLSVLRKKIDDKGKSTSFIQIGDKILDEVTKLIFFGYTQGNKMNSYSNKLNLTNHNINQKFYDDIIILKVPNKNILKFNQISDMTLSLITPSVYLKNTEVDDQISNEFENNSEVGLDDEQQKSIYNHLTTIKKKEIIEDVESEIEIGDYAEEIITEIQNDFTEEEYIYPDNFKI